MEGIAIAMKIPPACSEKYAQYSGIIIKGIGKVNVVQFQCKEPKVNHWAEIG